MTQETKTRWSSVYNIFTSRESRDALLFGPEGSKAFLKQPTQLLEQLTYYKFAAKMIGAGKEVLDLGCGEGMGTYLIAKECGGCFGYDPSAAAIESATANFAGERCAFGEVDETRQWEAIIQLNCSVWEEAKIAAKLKEDGVALIGSEQGDIGQKNFKQCFVFSVDDEVVRMGFTPKANYFIALCCQPR